MDKCYKNYNDKYVKPVSISLGTLLFLVTDLKQMVFPGPFVQRNCKCYFGEHPDLFIDNIHVFLSDIFMNTLMISFPLAGSGEGWVVLVLLNLTEFCLVKFVFNSPWNYFITWFFNAFLNTKYIEKSIFFSTFQSCEFQQLPSKLVDSFLFLFLFEPPPEISVSHRNRHVNSREN